VFACVLSMEIKTFFVRPRSLFAFSAQCETFGGCSLCFPFHSPASLSAYRTSLPTDKANEKIRH
jgi:hypothetical protein